MSPRQIATGVTMCAATLLVAAIASGSHRSAPPKEVAVAVSAPAPSTEETSLPEPETTTTEGEITTSTTRRPKPKPTTSTTTGGVVRASSASARPAVTTTTRVRIKPTTTTTKPKPTTTTTTRPRPTEEGEASWYDYHEGTCAHKTLPMGTIVTVTNKDNGRSTTCRVADRGPFVEGRIIDLERRVFAQVAEPSQGVFPARISW